MRALRIVALAATSAAIFTVMGRPAVANSFAATELSYDSALLSQFNLINLGNFTSTSNKSVGGRVLVGGNASLGTSTIVCTSTTACGNTPLPVSASPGASFIPLATNTPSSASGSGYGYGALTVFGNVTGSVAIGTTTQTGTIPVGVGGDIDVKGNVGTGTFALNNAGGINLGGTSTSGTTATNITDYRTAQATPPSGSGSSTGSNYKSGNSGASQSLTQVFAPFGNASAISTNFQTPLQDLYSGLANLPGTPGVKADALPSNQSGVFTSGIDYTGSNALTYGVVTTTLANFSAEGSSFTGVVNNASDAATFVIITGSGASSILPTITSADSKVIYDFVSASSLQLGSTFDGTILAPLASLANGTGSVTGTVVVASMTQTQNLYSGNAFTGDLSGLTNFTYNARVPEPASLLLLGSGLTGLAWLRRRHKKS